MPRQILERQLLVVREGHDFRCPGHTDVSMSEPFLHDLGVHTLGEHQRVVSMSGVM
jgi:hypothetical protein